jgi:hypothetical protein
MWRGVCSLRTEGRIGSEWRAASQARQHRFLHRLCGTVDRILHCGSSGYEGDDDGGPHPVPEGP